MGNFNENKDFVYLSKISLVQILLTANFVDGAFLKLVSEHRKKSLKESFAFFEVSENSIRTD